MRILLLLPVLAMVFMACAKSESGSSDTPGSSGAPPKPTLPTDFVLDLSTPTISTPEETAKLTKEYKSYVGNVLKVLPLAQYLTEPEHSMHRFRLERKLAGFGKRLRPLIENFCDFSRSSDEEERIDTDQMIAGQMTEWSDTGSIGGSRCPIKFDKSVISQTTAHEVDKAQGSGLFSAKMSGKNELALLSDQVKNLSKIASASSNSELSGTLSWVNGGKGGTHYTVYRTLTVNLVNGASINIKTEIEEIKKRVPDFSYQIQARYLITLPSGGVLTISIHNSTEEDGTRVFINGNAIKENDVPAELGVEVSDLIDIR